MARRKIIIGIHGLGNKPPKILLEDWWRLAIQEGLTRIKCKRKILNFELVYWADVLHPQPLDIHEEDDDDETYLDERYLPASENTEEEAQSFTSSVIYKIKDQLNNIMFSEKLHTGFPNITDFVIKHFFQDLSVYFTENCVDENNKECLAREVIRNRLKEVLKKYRNDEILLIAHSMGSIIAYDVLTELQSAVKIDTLITAGSPIGVPFIYEKLKKDTSQSKRDKMKTPDCIKRGWYNFADLNDKLAVNYKFEDMFSPNIHGTIPKSAIVRNDYQSPEGKNPHKSFGYLRTRQVAALVEDFIAPKHVKFGKWISDKVRGLLSKINVMEKK